MTNDQADRISGFDRTLYWAHPGHSLCMRVGIDKDLFRQHDAWSYNVFTVEFIWLIEDTWLREL